MYILLTKTLLLKSKFCNPCKKSLRWCVNLAECQGIRWCANLILNKLRRVALIEMLRHASQAHGRLAVLVLSLCLVYSNCTLFEKPYLICAENSWVKSNSPNKATWRVPNDIIVSSSDLRDVGDSNGTVSVQNDVLKQSGMV